MCRWRGILDRPWVATEDLNPVILRYVVSPGHQFIGLLLLGAAATIDLLSQGRAPYESQNAEQRHGQCNSTEYPAKPAFLLRRRPLPPGLWRSVVRLWRILPPGRVGRSSIRWPGLLVLERPSRRPGRAFSGHWSRFTCSAGLASVPPVEVTDGGRHIRRARCRAEGRRGIKTGRFRRGEQPYVE